MPRYSAALMLPGYLLMAVWGLLTFHRRRERILYPSQWFVLAAVFWFPWIYATANLLLLAWPVRGITQAAVAWWYANNLQLVCLALTGLAAVLYFIPKLTGRELHSRHLALLTFWGL